LTKLIHKMLVFPFSFHKCVNSRCFEHFHIQPFSYAKMATTILWVDSNAESTSSFRNQLLQYSQVQIFTSINPCFAYIESHPMQRLFLIASGSLARTLVPQVYNYEHLKQIFVFCRSIAAHTDWAADYIDKILMYDHPDDLLERLWREMEKDFRQQADDCIRQANASKERADQHKQKSCG
jgi:hypothetical protein